MSRKVLPLAKALVFLLVGILAAASVRAHPAQLHQEPLRGPRQGGLIPGRPPLVIPTPITRPTTTASSSTLSFSTTTQSTTASAPSTPSPSSLLPEAVTETQGTSPSTTTNIPSQQDTAAPTSPSTSLPNAAVSNDEVDQNGNSTAPPTAATPTVTSTPTSSGSVAATGTYGLWGLITVPRNKLDLHRTHMSPIGLGVQGVQGVHQVLIAPLKWAQVVPQEMALIPTAAASPSASAPSMLLVPLQPQPHQHQHPLAQRLHHRPKDTASYLVGLPGGLQLQQDPVQVQHLQVPQLGLVSLGGAKPLHHHHHHLVPVKSSSAGHRHKELLLSRSGDGEDGEGLVLQADCGGRSTAAAQPIWQQYGFFSD